jgi:hypothetical protein
MFLAVLKHGGNELNLPNFDNLRKSRGVCLLSAQCDTAYHQQPYALLYFVELGSSTFTPK